jgi:copper resistance protein B
MTRAFAALLVLAATSAANADEGRYAFVSADRIEYQTNVDRSVWDLQGWYGGDTNKFWWKLEGSNSTGTENELQLLYSRAISPYFDAQVGARVADDPDETESAFLIGIRGLAPYNVEIDVAASVDADGDFEFHGEFEHDIRFSQRVVLQPRLELRAASAGDDLTAAEVRLRYEITRKIAPYFGISWQRRSVDDAPDDSSTALVAGLRFWF